MRCAGVGGLIVALAMCGCGARSSLIEGSRDAGLGGASTTGSASASSSAITSTSASSSSGAPQCTSSNECGCTGACCGGRCANTLNDVRNCGGCNNVCPGPHPYCDHGACSKPPCDADAGSGCNGGSFCCGSTCCAPGELCCTTQFACCETTKCQPPNELGTCDIGAPCTQCAAPDTPIATPEGERAIASLVAGDLVYTVHRGAVVALPLLAVNRKRVEHHHVVEVTLAGGSVLHISPRHPTADGRAFADLSAGADLGGIAVLRAVLVPYDEPYTYDILPGSDSGTYFAAGALIGSTLGP